MQCAAGWGCGPTLLRCLRQSPAGRQLGVAPDTLGLSVTVAAAICQAICLHRFVELSLLLSAGLHRREEDEEVFQLIGGRLRPARSVRPIATFAAWTSAFLRFAGVYL